MLSTRDLGVDSITFGLEPGFQREGLRRSSQSTSGRSASARARPNCTAEVCLLGPAPSPLGFVTGNCRETGFGFNATPAIHECHMLKHEGAYLLRAAR